MNGALGNLLRNSQYGSSKHRTLLRIVVVSLLFVLLMASVAEAQYCTPDECDECNLCDCCLNCCHEPPEMWVLNTRCVPKCNNLDAGFERISYKRYDAACGRFVTECRDSFLANEASTPTLFYIHGNTLKHKGAMKGFWQVYHKMRCCPGPKRLVCWSWPAQRERAIKGLRIRKVILGNLRIKHTYAEYQGYYLAKLVQQMSLSQRVMLAGHSYGAITASTAAHWLGGGCLRGLTLEGGVPVERPNLRLGMISGSFDNDALLPGYRYGQALVAAEKIFVTRNSRDSTLRKWPKVSYRGRPALGVTGLNANRLGQYRHKLCQKTMTADVDKSHYLKPHLKSTRFVSMLCCLSFPSCHNCTVPVVGEPVVGEPVVGEPVAGEPVAGEPVAGEQIDLHGAKDKDVADKQDDVTDQTISALRHVGRCLANQWLAHNRVWRLLSSKAYAEFTANLQSSIMESLSRKVAVSGGEALDSNFSGEQDGVAAEANAMLAPARHFPLETLFCW